MQWAEYRELIESPPGEYRTNVPALFADADVFDELVDDLATRLDSDEFGCVAGIDAMGFIPGTALARRFDVGFLAIRKDEKLPIREEHRVADSLVDYTGAEKTLEVDVRQVPGEPVLVVDDWMETASQVGTAIDLIERAGGTVAGVALLAAEDTAETRRIDAEYGVASIKPFR